ncbi:hypothetical protein ACFL4K_01835 [Candidatus Neomarinimicrobiota bacterium]
MCLLVLNTTGPHYFDDAQIVGHDNNVRSMGEDHPYRPQAQGIQQYALCQYLPFLSVKPYRIYPLLR